MVAGDRLGSLPGMPSDTKAGRAQRLLSGPQRHTLLFGGARSGKTVLFVKAIMERAVHACGTRHAMLRLRANAARASLWLDTLPKVARHSDRGLDHLPAVVDLGNDAIGLM